MVDRGQILTSVTFRYLNGSSLTLEGESFVDWLQRYAEGTALLEQQLAQQSAPEESPPTVEEPTVVVEPHRVVQVRPVNLRDITGPVKTATADVKDTEVDEDGEN